MEMNKITESERQRISYVLNKYDVTKFTILDDGRVVVHVSVWLQGDFKDFQKENIKLYKVEGHLAVGGADVTSLKGCPEIVGKDFSMLTTRLDNLIGSPKEVGGNFGIAADENISSLEGAPVKIGGNVNLQTCPILVQRYGNVNWKALIKNLNRSKLFNQILEE